MKKCKRVLAILLAAVMIGGVGAVGASAAGMDDLTNEQLQEYLDLAAQAILTISFLGNFDETGFFDFLRFKPGRSRETFRADAIAVMEALIAENGWNVEVKTLFPDAQTEDLLVGLYLNGATKAYMDGIAAACEKVLNDNVSFLVQMEYNIYKWFVFFIYKLGPLFWRLEAVVLG